MEIFNENLPCKCKISLRIFFKYVSRILWNVPWNFGFLEKITTNAVDFPREKSCELNIFFFRVLVNREVTNNVISLVISY